MSNPLSNLYRSLRNYIEEWREDYRRSIPLSRLLELEPLVEKAKHDALIESMLRIQEQECKRRKLLESILRQYSNEANVK